MKLNTRYEKVHKKNNIYVERDTPNRNYFIQMRNDMRMYATFLDSNPSEIKNFTRPIAQKFKGIGRWMSGDASCMPFRFEQLKKLFKFINKPQIFVPIIKYLLKQPILKLNYVSLEWLFEQIHKDEVTKILNTLDSDDKTPAIRASLIDEEGCKRYMELFIRYGACIPPDNLLPKRHKYFSAGYTTPLRFFKENAAIENNAMQEKLTQLWKGFFSREARRSIRYNNCTRIDLAILNQNEGGLDRMQAKKTAEAIRRDYPEYYPRDIQGIIDRLDDDFITESYRTREWVEDLVKVSLLQINLIAVIDGAKTIQEEIFKNNIKILKEFLESVERYKDLLNMTHLGRLN